MRLSAAGTGLSRHGGAARDDAASFVASEGSIRGVKLESAIDHIRHKAPQLSATDAQLAQAILTI